MKTQITSKVVSSGSTQTPKLAVSLYSAKQPKPASLFRIVSKLVSVLYIWTNIVGHPTMWGWGWIRRFCVFTVVSHPKLLALVQSKLRNQLFYYFMKQPKLTSLFRIASKLATDLSMYMN